VLTSDPDAAPEVLTARAAAAAEAGCGGRVCAAADLAVVRRAAPGLLSVVPGIRPSGAPGDDQGRIATPGGAIAAGADILVVGRGVTAAPDPERSAAAVAAEVAAAAAPPRG
jgi:orotidine-5'-phosphate decarboxylase